MKPILILSALFLSALSLFAQEKVSAPETKPVKRPADRVWGDGGAGIGLDYGGLIGVKAAFNPVAYMGIFAGVGWDLVGVGWNIGVLGRAIPADRKHAVRPYLKVMYGTNGVTKVTGKSGYDKMFYGLTPGIGCEFRFGRWKSHGLNIDIGVPLRSSDFFDQINRMKNDPQIEKVSEVYPVSFSIGYHAVF